MNVAKDSWYILGPGAIGCLWAAYWRAENTPVTLIQRELSPDSSVEFSRAGNVSSYPLQTTTIEQLLKTNSTIKQLFISTKAQHTQLALAPLLPLISQDATILIVQNGIAALDLPGQLPGRQLFAGVTTDGAYRTGKMQVTHAGQGTTMIGPLAGNKNTRLPKQLPTMGLDIQPCDDIEKRLWQKFAINCTINPLTVKYQCRNGELLTLPVAKEELFSLCSEVQLISSAIKPRSWFLNLAADVEKVLQLTSGNINSMLQDIRKGRETELSQLNMLLVMQAEKLGIPCPINKALIETILDLHNES